MRLPRKCNKTAIGAVCALLLGMVSACAVTPTERDSPQLGLLTTLPIYWNEAANVGEVLKGADELPWARSALENDYQLVPLDTLSEGAGERGASLGELDLLLLAQPRALSGEENVALDQWVRAGGQVLVFADPMLTGHSQFHIGDRRRPQDVVLLSPILRRWGLDLQYDEAQPPGERAVQLDDLALPANLAGQFGLVATAPDAPADCQIGGEGLVADCAIGKGRALVIADAAVFDSEDGSGGSLEALRALADRAFSER